MPQIYKISKSWLRLFYKIRHRKGHGIHSPFVYSLVTKVIEEKSPYYAYGEINKCLKKAQNVRKKISKNEQLAFRLVNHFKPETILELGAGYGANTLCLTAPSKQIKCICYEKSEKKYNPAKILYESWERKIVPLTGYLPEINEKPDCIYINLMYFAQKNEYINNLIINSIKDNLFIIIRGIRTNKKSQLLWNCLKGLDKVTVSLDLFHTGILFFNPKLHKRNYRISF